MSINNIRNGGRIIQKRRMMMMMMMTTTTTMRRRRALEPRRMRTRMQRINWVLRMVRRGVESRRRRKRMNFILVLTTTTRMATIITTQTRTTFVAVVVVVPSASNGASHSPPTLHGRPSYRPMNGYDNYTPIHSASMKYEPMDMIASNMLVLWCSYHDIGCTW